MAEVSKTPVFILQPYVDENGLQWLSCSPNNGQTVYKEYGPEGKIYRQHDADMIQKLTFDKLKFKSPDGTAFYLSVSDDGQPVFTKVEKEDDSQ